MPCISPWPARLISPTSCEPLEVLRDFVDVRVPFPGADEREIQTAQRLLKASTEPGLVAAAYAVDDDAIGEKWRLERAVQQDESHARVVINGVSDRLCTAVVARVKRRSESSMILSSWDEMYKKCPVSV